MRYTIKLYFKGDRNTEAKDYVILKRDKKHPDRITKEFTSAYVSCIGTTLDGLYPIMMAILEFEKLGAYPERFIRNQSNIFIAHRLFDNEVVENNLVYPDIITFVNHKIDATSEYIMFVLGFYDGTFPVYSRWDLGIYGKYFDHIAYLMMISKHI